MKGSINLPDFSDMHILIVGDIMVDRYISGEVKRISPEAPVPVVEQRHFENRAGGAANVALNVLELGAKATLLSITGSDEGRAIISEVLDLGERLTLEFVTCKDRKTTVKTRVMAGYQHLIRVDNEDKHDISSEQERIILDKFKGLIDSGQIDGVILQDYNKGMLTKTGIEAIMDYCSLKQIPTFVDPKEKNFFAYRGCTIFKPNKKEVTRSTGIFSDLDAMDGYLRERLSHNITLITLGQDGLYVNDGSQGATYATAPRIIADVCGAGDSVISVVSLCYLKGMDMSSLANVANIAGGQVCESPGVVPVNYEKLRQELVKNDNK
ncbi:MAG: PfkB family carbohydrate kinase [Chitinophagales bacterium]|nr:PfkB family carbohydrate kinase [Chitinophagales bacterium]